MGLTDRTWGVFDTAAFRAGEVYDETFPEQARSTLEGIRQVLLAGGWKASGVEEHSHYGVALTVDGVSGRRARLLLQAVGPWLLTVTRERTFLERLRGAPEDEVPEDFVRAVRAAVPAAGALASRWFTQAAYEEAARGPGNIDLTQPSEGDTTTAASS